TPARTDVREYTLGRAARARDTPPPPDEESELGLRIPHGAPRCEYRLHAARELVQRSLRVAGAARRSGGRGVDRGAGGRHAFSAERGAARLAAGGGRSFKALFAAVTADSRRTERTRVPLAGGRERGEAQVHAAARQRRA